MSDVAVIQKATLYEMADAIIDTTERTESFKVSDMPTLIREDVYDAGYNKGYAEGEAAAKPILYGTYMLTDNPNFPLPSDYITLDLSVCEAYAYFYNGSEYKYRNIDNIQFGDDGIVYITTSEEGDFCTSYDGALWVTEGYGDFPDDRYKVIDIKTPISVTKEKYDLFMGIVDCDTESTPFAVGNEIGYADGKQAQYDEFWDNLQNYGNRGHYAFVFSRIANEYARPKYKVVPTIKGGARSIFEASANLKKVESAYFDFSKLPRSTSRDGGLYYMFSSCTSLEEIEDVRFSLQTYLDYTFAWSRKLHTIAKIPVDENTQFNHVFDSCNNLVNLTIEGTIGQNGLNLQHSTKLSKASIQSVILHLSKTTSGLSVTFSKTAVDFAFDDGTTIGSETVAWLGLIAEFSNWTINLV